MPTTCSTDRTRALSTAAGRLAPMLLTALLAACAHDEAGSGAGATPAAPGPGALAAGPAAADGAAAAADGAAAAGRGADAAPEAATAAWPPQLREWSDKARATWGVPTLSAGEAAALPADVLIVDVREPREVAVSGIPRAVALTSEATRAEFARQAAGETVLVYCTVGWRSAQYTQQLADAGVKAFNLDGGLCAWAAAGRPLVDPQGRPVTAIHAYSRDFADCVPPGYTAVTE